jgi:hypothetical protein
VQFSEKQVVRIGEWLGHFAAAFAFATVFAFAAHVARFTAALAFAAIHPLAIVLIHARVGRLRAGARTARDGDDAARQQSRHGRRED